MPAMPENVTACPLCGSPDSRLFDERVFRGHTVVNRLCRGCGLVYQSPRMTAAELDAFYAREYRQVYQGSEGPTPKDLAAQRGRAESLLGFLRAAGVSPTRHLDIGASAGILLRRFGEAFGCQSVGVEPGEAYRAYARGQGLTLYADLDALRAADEAPFDLVSMAHVLEHLPDPVGYLAALKDGVLAADGVLLLEVPNLYAHDCFEVAHLTSFSPHTLRQTLLQAGYTVMALHRHGQPRSELLPLYLTALAHPARGKPPAVQPERGVARKRRGGLLRRRALERLFPHRAWKPLKGEDA
ncbi:MAG: methyltransferase domain-containing protein [Anaerolineae bacterium]|nr:MAG: methyltransferase domain-containing protein [Anaerolineae bacterium]